MIADGFTKVLPPNKWNHFLRQIGLVEVLNYEVANEAPLEAIQEQLKNLTLVQ
jgi:hypothetical protein